MKNFKSPVIFLTIILGLIGFFSLAAARDFTIQSTVGVPYLKVDGSTGYVGIATATPGAPLVIHKEQGRTAYTGTAKGLVHLIGGSNDGDLTTITFSQSQGGNPLSIIGSAYTLTGTRLFFGNSESFGSGITSIDMVVAPGGVSVNLGSSTPQYNLDVGGSGRFTQPVIVGTPTANSHAATKSYVDSSFTGGSATGTLASLQVTGTTTLATTGGNVGIGTTTPSQKLEVSGGRILVTGSSYVTNPAGPIFGQYTSSVGYVQAPAGGDFAIWNDATQNIALFKDNQDSIFFGNVGIGTTTPNDKLELYSAITPGFALSNGASNVKARLAMGGTGKTALYTINYNTVSDVLDKSSYAGWVSYLGTDNVDQFSIRRIPPGGNGASANILFLINSSGNIGIATTTPSYKLDVVGTAQFSQPIIVGTPTAASHAATKSYVDSSFTGGSATGTLAQLQVTGTTTLATTGGRVGIGTTTPTQKLVVDNGNILLSDSNWVGLSNIYGISFSSNNGYSSFDSATDIYLNIDSNNSDADTKKFVIAKNGITSAGTALVTVLEGGNVGIGDTGPDQVLEVMSANIGATQITVSNSNTGDADAQIGFELSDTVNSFTVGVDDSDSDKFKISTTALGTSDRLVIDSSGNIGIGTAIPSARLNVVGAADATQLIVNANGTQSNSNPLVQLRKSDNNVLSSWHSDSSSNLFLGYNNGINNNITGIGSEGLDNVFIGALAGNANATGTRNTAVGSEAFEFNTVGTYNSAFGSFASHYNVSGSNNSSFGQFSNYQNQTGSNNTAVGAEAGYSNTSGSGNVFLGYRAGYSETGSNKLYIANSSTNPPLIFGDFSAVRVGIATNTPSYTFDVVGTAQFSQPVIVGTPTAASHAATKSYVDSSFTGGSATGTLAQLIVTGTTTLATTAGNVGIGTTTPDYKLTVGGTGYFSSDLTVGGLLNTSGDVNISGYAYAKKFYDIDDSSWYIDPSSSTSSIAINGAISIATTSFGYPLTVASTSGALILGVSSQGEGQIMVPGGSATLPAIAFDGDSNTGIYTINTDEVSITTGGTRRAIINSTGIIGGNAVSGGPVMIDAAGTTTTPAFTFYSDTDTGLSRSGTNFMSFITGGSARMVVDASGNVGIGDTTPSYTLDVSGTGQFTQPLLVGTPTLDGHAATKSYIDPYAVFMKVTGTGTSTYAYSVLQDNIAIGDYSLTAPTAKLEVDGGIRLNPGASAAKPTCNSSQRGTFWYTESAALVQDKLEICVKTGSDTYTWFTIY